MQRDGWSVFAEGKVSRRFSLIGRYDRFDPDTSAADDANDRLIGGVAYHIGRGNAVLFDVDRVSYEKPGRRTDTRYQLTLQVKY